MLRNPTLTEDPAAGLVTSSDTPPTRQVGVPADAGVCGSTSRVGALLRTVSIGAMHAIWPALLVLTVWGLWVEIADVPPAVAPSPIGVLSYIAAHPDVFVSNTVSTLFVVVLGLALGTTAGALLATVSWFSTLARGIIGGPALVTQCLPIVTIVPVLARVFGFETRTIVIITALIAFFPVFVFTASGLRRTPPGADDVFVVLGASRRQQFLRLALPAATPNLLVAVRISVVVGVCRGPA